MFGKSVKKRKTSIADPKLVARSPGRGESRAHVILGSVEEEIS